MGFRLRSFIGKAETAPPSFPRRRESGTLNFQTTFEYCRRPAFWIPACAGMTIYKFPKRPKKPKSDRQDFRFRGDDGIFVTVATAFAVMTGF
ncbi:hypothetical protein [Neisseria meningitidis]|uniref:hypothetical protein n=1 Tax=Neisseria meningitidis TaxID=487 RepID=UPI0011874151|nr:hypothetical protein [Neisseria meningitidis]